MVAIIVFLFTFRLQAVPRAQRFKYDTSVSFINSLFPKIDNLEYFPMEVLLEVFMNLDDMDLLSCAISSYRFDSIAQVAFKEKYAEKYFLVENDPKVVLHSGIESKRDMYCELFKRFGQSIKAIEVKRIEGLNDSHWLVPMIQQHTNQIEKLTFDHCEINGIEPFLSQHINITDLSLHYCYCERYVISQFPMFRNLKKFTLEWYELASPAFDEIDVLKIIRQNPALETLVLDVWSYHPGEILLVIAENLKHLKELYVKGGPLRETPTWELSNESIDMLIDSLKHLESLGLAISSHQTDLLRRLGSKCKNIKTLALDYIDNEIIVMDRRIITALHQFKNVTSLKLNHLDSDRPIEQIVEQLPNLRNLEISSASSLDVDVLSVLRKSETLEKIALETIMESMNAEFLTEFSDIMQNRHGRIEYKGKEEGKVTGYVTTEEIVWRNKLLHWIGYDHSKSSSSLNLLDLASQSSVSDAERPFSFDQILCYLDVDSLHSLSTVSKRSKQLVDRFVKRTSNEEGVFIITDEFHSDGNGYDIIKEHAKRVKMHFFEMNNIKRLLQNHDEFPKVQHVIFDLYDPFDNTKFFHEIFQLFPAVETFEMKNNVLTYYDVNGNEADLRKLKKLTFKYSKHQFRLDYLQNVFKNAQTELISIIDESEENREDGLTLEDVVNGIASGQYVTRAANA